MPAGTPAIDMAPGARAQGQDRGRAHQGRSSSSSRRTRSTGSRARRVSPAKAGSTSFEGEKQTLAAKEIIVATGSAPRSVPGIEIDHKRIITSDEAIHLTEVPKSLVIMGSGAVGVEFASIFRRFGSEVTIIELLPRLVPVEDEAVSAELEKSFKKQGIKSLTGTKVTKAAADGERRRHRGADAGRQDAEAVGRDPARGHRSRSRDGRARRRGARHRDGEGIHQGRCDVPHVGPAHLGHRRRDHARAVRAIRSSRTSRRRKASSLPSGSRGRRSSR